MNDIIKKPAQPIDGFADFNADNNEGDADQRSGSRLAGMMIKFTNEARWEISGDLTDITGQELLAVNIRRTEVRWGDAGPLEVKELAPGDRYRDLDALNETVPKSEWREGPDGKLQGPWKKQHVLELVDVSTMARYSWPTGTVGGTMAITELRDRVLLMRKFRGADVYPMVALADVHMRTRFGGRQRPHLRIVGWTRAGGGGDVEPISTEATAPALAPPTAPAALTTPVAPPASSAPTPPNPSQPATVAAGNAKARAKTKAAPVALQPVSEPTLAEEMQDKVPW
jgi:hypothetical protein